MSRAGDILQRLAECPATTGQISKELNYPIRNTCSQLRQLASRGKVDKIKFSTGPKGRKMIWFLTASTDA